MASEDDAGHSKLYDLLNVSKGASDSEIKKVRAKKITKKKKIL